MTSVDGTFDIDEVLARYLDVLLVWHNKEYGTHLRLSDISDYSIHKIIGCSWEEERHRLDLFERSDAVRRIQPEKGIEHVIALTYEYNLALVTSRPNRMRLLTRDWLRDTVGDAFNGTYHTDHDGFGKPLHTKAELCTALGARFHVDDSRDHALALARAGIAVVLYGDVPYNKEPTPDGLDIVRRYDLKSTTDHIRSRFTPRTA